MHTIIEPFKIKSVEPIYFTTPQQREEILQKAFYNPFLIQAKEVMIDLLTDSGTSAMSSEQWAGCRDGTLRRRKGRLPATPSGRAPGQ